VKILRSGFFFVVLSILGGLLVLVGQEEQPKKIAIASEGETIDSQVGRQGARCPWLLFFDEDGQFKEALENPYQQKRGRAGVGCAGLLSEKGVGIFVAGNIGDKMADALDSEDIVFIPFSGSVKDAIAHVLDR
jgi:predicted Fe-Mo cluster-binding NifX family protein